MLIDSHAHLNFKAFEENEIVQEKGFSWEVEKDTMDWEHAVDGIRYLQEKINKIKPQKGDKSSRQISKSEYINKLYGEGYFKESKKMTDIMNELKKLGVNIKLTSLPSYLLPLVRKRKLIREQITEGKRKIWVYKSI